MFRIILVFFVFSSCAQPTPQGKKRSTSYDEVAEFPKNTPLFRNQKEKLFQLTLKNERKKDPKVDALLETVELAIKQNDLELLFSVMDEEIISSYGGGVLGYEGIEEVWGGDYDKLWNRLDKILAMGGSFTGDSTYQIPYEGNLAVEAQKIDDMMVPHECGLTTNESAMIYPNAKCRSNEGIQIGRTFAIVDLLSKNYQQDSEAIKINLLGTGIHGFVRKEDFYISSDYSLFIEKNNEGNWKIAAFAPWD